MKQIITFLIACLCTLYAQAQDAKAHYAFEAKTAVEISARIPTLQLDTLSGMIPVLYSKGYKVRAKTIQKLVEECVAFYGLKFPEVKFDFRIMLLNHNDWYQIHLEKLSYYGMPNCIPEIDKLFIAADKKAVGELFGETDTTSDTHLSRFDVIALHELGHLFLQSSNHLYTGKLWTDEFLASYFATCFLKEHPQYPLLPQVGETNYNPPHRTLADFERLYGNVGARNYGWYEGQFQNLGYGLYPMFKTELIGRFIDNDLIEQKKLDPLVLLQQLAPEITDQWLKEMGQPER